MPRFCRSSPDFSYQNLAPSPLDLPANAPLPNHYGPLQQRLHDAMPCPALPLFSLAATSCSASSNKRAVLGQTGAHDLVLFFATMPCAY